MKQASRALPQRPGLVTFAAFMMFVLGGFSFTWALVEFANAAWLRDTVYGTFNGYLWLWGIVDLLIATCAFIAGYDLLQGGRFGQIYGVLLAGFSAIRWFFNLAAVPWVAAVVLAIDVLIIYGLVMNTEYFKSSETY